MTCETDANASVFFCMKTNQYEAHTIDQTNKNPRHSPQMRFYFEPTPPVSKINDRPDA